jgi:hypothetical protein
MKIWKRKRYINWKDKDMLDHHLPSLRMIILNNSWMYLSSPTIVVPYPISKIQLRSSVVHAPNQLSREIRSLQSNHVASITQESP